MPCRASRFSRVRAAEIGSPPSIVRNMAEYFLSHKTYAPGSLTIWSLGFQCIPAVTPDIVGGFFRPLTMSAHDRHVIEAIGPTTRSAGLRV
jgi:hypothetical protein